MGHTTPPDHPELTQYHQPWHWHSRCLWPLWQWRLHIMRIPTTHIHIHQPTTLLLITSHHHTSQSTTNHLSTNQHQVTTLLLPTSPTMHPALRLVQLTLPNPGAWRIMSIQHMRSNTLLNITMRSLLLSMLMSLTLIPHFLSTDLRSWSKKHTFAPQRLATSGL